MLISKIRIFGNRIQWRNKHKTSIDQENKRMKDLVNQFTKRKVNIRSLQENNTFVSINDTIKFKSIKAALITEVKIEWETSIGCTWKKTFNSFKIELIYIIYK